MVVKICKALEMMMKAGDGIPTESDDPVSRGMLSLLLATLALLSITGITADPLSLSALNKTAAQCIANPKYHVLFIKP